MIKIWGRTNSLNVQKVLWCCVELSVEFERVDWGGQYGGNDDPRYRSMNPSGRIPTVEDGTAILWESNTILRYLCSTRDGDALYPLDPYERSKVERWMDWQLAALNPPMSTLLMSYYRTPPAQRNVAALETAAEQSTQQWAIMNGWLKNHAYLAGDAFTLADIGNGILAHRWFSYPIERADFPFVRAWYERLGTQSGFQKYVAGPVS